MERKRNLNTAAFTRVELIVVIIIIAVLASMLIPAVHRVKVRSERIDCISHLKQIGTASRVWSNDHNTNNPASASVQKGGWKEFLDHENAGQWCWTNYAIMQNELGLSPRILVCPSDERNWAESFTNMNNQNISYFVGVGTDESSPGSFFGGDRNLGRGATPDKDYGFSPSDGKGNDVAIQTNSVADPISWSLKMHSAGNSSGAGNILLGDASVQQITSKQFRTDYQPFARNSGNWSSNHVPAVPSFRLIFP